MMVRARVLVSRDAQRSAALALRSEDSASRLTQLPSASRLTQRRRGITLMEVLVALVILLFSCVAIYQLVSIGTDRAIDVKFYARASMLCQSKLEELKIGAEPLTGGGPTAFKEDGDADYQYEIGVEDAGVDGLKKVRVTVKRDKGDGGAVEVSLSRFVLDPALRGTTFDKLNTSSSGSTSGMTGGTTP